MSVVVRRKMCFSREWNPGHAASDIVTVVNELYFVVCVIL
jgi:hypothetical protein